MSTKISVIEKDLKTIKRSSKEVKKKLRENPSIYKVIFEGKSIPQITNWPQTTNIILKKNFKGFSKVQIRVKNLRVQVPSNKKIELDLRSIPCVTSIALIGGEIRLKGSSRTIENVSIHQKKDNKIDFEKYCPCVQNLVSNKKLELSNEISYFVKYMGVVINHKFYSICLDEIQRVLQK